MHFSNQHDVFEIPQVAACDSSLFLGVTVLSVVSVPQLAWPSL